MDRVDCVVVGAGVVGLAVGRALALGGNDVIVLESESGIGRGVSSRNSEVVHAGIYYDAGSLKARLCVRGRRQLYDYCDERGVPYKKTEKFIVGTEAAHESSLANILARARNNDVDDIDWIDSASAIALEPALHCKFALHSRQTGIVDSHALMLSLQHDIESAGGAVVLSSPFDGATRHHDEWHVRIGGREPVTIASRWLINSAGLDAQNVAARIDELNVSNIPPRYLARGCYFSLTEKSPFTRLIYPVPVVGGLGTHLTLDLAGQARFGPDVEWIGTVDFTVNKDRVTQFYSDIRQYWPALPDNSLAPSFAGIRPKLSRPNERVADFVIATPDDHNVAALVNLFGIESPGLTASLAIGEYVAEAVARPYQS